MSPYPRSRISTLGSGRRTRPSIPNLFLQASLLRLRRCRRERRIAISVEEDPNRNSRLVFISHSSADTWVAKQIAREIKARGATPFLDEAQVDAGADFEEDILNFLERAHELVVLLTPWALDRPYVWAEIGAAWGRRIPIVALLLGLTATELQTRPGVPVLLKKRDLLLLNEIDIYLGQLEARVRQ
jgi:hypothetical protein